MNYQDIYVTEDFDEAEQFRYEHNNQAVEVGTPVGFERVETSPNGTPIYTLVCCDGIYYQSDE